MSELCERLFDFDTEIDRRGSESAKWGFYGNDVLPMWVADMDFRSPAPVIEALRRRVDHGVFGYAMEPPELRTAIVERIDRRYGWKVSPDALVLLPNVVVGFNLACHTVGSPGDGVVMQPPVYFPILRIPENTGMTARFAQLARTADGRYEIDVDRFRVAAERSKVFVLCSPHNPVGRVFTERDLERMADLCLERDLVICSDEIHADFTYDGRRHRPIASLSPEIERRTITLFSPTKSFNIAGLDCAIAVVPDPVLRKRYLAATRGLVPSVGIMGYTAALAAFRDGDPWLDQLVAYLQENRDLAAQSISEEMPGIAMTSLEGTYLAWLDCRDAGIPGNPHEFFLSEAKVAMNDGAAFGLGGEGFVRLNLACPRATLRRGLERMRDALRERTGDGP